MRDLIFITVIIVFWFGLASVLTYIYEDDLIIKELIEGNSSYLIDVDTNEIAYNLSLEAATGEYGDIGITKTKGFISMLGRILTFRIPTTASIPQGIISIIEFFNFMLVLLMGLLVYRLFRSGSG